MSRREADERDAQVILAGRQAAQHELTPRIGRRGAAHLRDDDRRVGERCAGRIHDRAEHGRSEGGASDARVGAKIGRHSIVGAGSLVTEGKEFPDGALIVGSPAKVVRMLTPEQIERLAWSAAH